MKKYEFRFETELNSTMLFLVNAMNIFSARKKLLKEFPTAFNIENSTIIMKEEEFIDIFDWINNG